VSGAKQDQLLVPRVEDLAVTTLASDPLDLQEQVALHVSFPTRDHALQDREKLVGTTV
jgi:hypothetical protein